MKISEIRGSTWVRSDNPGGTDPIFSALTIYFLGYVIIDILRGRIAPNMVPFPADLRELFQSLLWYFGLRDRPAAPRFDFRQKFEFWGMLMGGLLMVASGLILYFPIETARWLPAQIIPAAKTAHSNEALLALLVIVLWHLYGTIFRPSVFPLDKAMTNGNMPVERLEEEHSLEYARLFPDKSKEPHSGLREITSEGTERLPSPGGKQLS